MKTLLIGCDSAWTARNSGALVGVLCGDDGRYSELGPPITVRYDEAERVIDHWISEFSPSATVQFLDQPTIVKNLTGQRPVENIVAGIISRRYGGMQPANRSRMEMFGDRAPVWGFLEHFGGPANPLTACSRTGVIETYPALAIIALGWTLPDPAGRATGRLPKYNPGLKKKFSFEDWQHVCGLAMSEFSERGLAGTAHWITDLRQMDDPHKCDQDGLDACICLLVALYLAEGKECLMVGNMETGYIVVPHNDELSKELEGRCRETERKPVDWVRRIRWGSPGSAVLEPCSVFRLLDPFFRTAEHWRISGLRCYGCLKW
jgi:predicted RNase H-like nuclease